MRVTHGWAGSVQDFLSTSLEVWLRSLDSHFRGLNTEAPSTSQVEAWKDEHKVVSDSLRKACRARKDAKAWSLAFEYELPLEGGRRPDLVVLAEIGRASCRERV